MNLPFFSKTLNFLLHSGQEFAPKQTYTARNNLLACLWEADREFWENIKGEILGKNWHRERLGAPRNRCSRRILDYYYIFIQILAKDSWTHFGNWLTFLKTMRRSDFQCPICFELPKKAVDCNCCHNIFCEKCAFKYKISPTLVNLVH